MTIEKAFPSVIDSTMLSAWSACEMLMNRQYIENWKPAGESIHLHAGGAYARGLEVARLHYLETGDSLTAIDMGVAALEEAYGDFDSGDGAKSKDRMVGALLFYFSQYPMATDSAQLIRLKEMPGVEFSFAIPLPIRHPETGNPLLFSGRCDAIVEFAGGIYALDDKTTSSLGASWAKQWDLRGQFTGYAWALRELGISVAGTLVRGVSILKTKYDTSQAIVGQPDWKVNRWYEQSMAKIERMVLAYNTNNFLYDFSESCNHYGGCPMRSVCLSRDPESLLQTYYEQRVWNPLTHTEEAFGGASK